MGTPIFSPPDFHFNSTDIFGYDDQPPKGSVINAYQMVPVGGNRTVNINTGGEPFAVFSRGPSLTEIREFGKTTAIPNNRLIFQKPPPFVKIVAHNNDMEGTTEFVIVKLSDSTKTSTLTVTAKVNQQIAIKVFTLEDSLRVVTKALDLDLLREVISNIKKIYFNQANVTLTHLPPFTQPLSVEGNMGLPIFLEDAGCVINGKTNKSPMDFFEDTFKSSTARVNFILTWHALQNKNNRKGLGGLTPVGGNFSVILPIDVSATLLTQRMAHEMIHALGKLGHVINNDQVLMSVDENPNAPWRMVRDDIDLVNKSGMKVFIDPKYP